ncbi:MAG TPA: neutral zinc metallopeptidase [Sphingomicrobium sp.]|jgi:uncharacterized protein|nr:neutral zinc metallopeptidase [Sphingomicrobium sp.]
MVRLGGQDPSGNFLDRTGRGGMGFGGGRGGGLGGVGLGLLMHFVGRRFGIVGILVLLLGFCALSTFGTGGLLTEGGGGQQRLESPGGQSRLDPHLRDFLPRVLGSTEAVWNDIFAAAGTRYRPTTMVAYSNYDQSGCGAAQAAMGPFYCPSDQRIYIDPTFFTELSTRFGAPGDFAMAYVIAHEVGHHVQNLEGTLARVQRAQQRAGRGQGNAMQVAVELQADCYAGVWAARARDSQGSILEPGDLEEGMRAAEAIGDDTLQRRTQGRVVPESFTHGTAAQRQAALRRGFDSGDPASCVF